MKAIHLWLEPDREIPRFSRLQWQIVPATLREVLLTGIHPWQGGDKYLSVMEALLNRLNAPEAKLPELVPLGCGYDLSRPAGVYYTPHGLSPFERLLETIRASIVFVDGLSLIELMEIADQRLRERWSHETAKRLMDGAYPVFQDMRRFLKRKNRKLKLSGYGDVDRYDLGRELSLDDFSSFDRLKLNQAVPVTNFRHSALLGDITDAQGRLQLISEIRDFSLSEVDHRNVYTGLVWRCRRKGQHVRLEPDIGGSHDKRQRAWTFAEKWREDDGRLCFETSLDKVDWMVEDGYAAATFPTLDYPGYLTAGIDKSRFLSHKSFETSILSTR